MKISSRLSIAFSFIASAIFIAFGITVYLFSSNHRNEDFKEKLKQRVIITEKVFLEKETFTSEELQKITNEFLHTLPEETEEVVEIIPGQSPVFKHSYPSAVLGHLTSNETYDFNNDDLQGMSRIFEVKGKKYLIIVTAVDQVGLQNISFLKRVILLLGLIGIPLIFIASFMMTKRALLPISKKIKNANKISSSNLHQRLTIYNPNDEIGMLAIAFNKLLDRLEASFEAQKSFIRNASHEIRNPLTAIMGEAEIAVSKARTNEEYKESLTTILTEAETLNSTVTNLLQLSKVNANEEKINYENILFDEFLKEIKESFDFIYPDNNVQLSIDRSAGHINYVISGNKNLLKTAIINLFDNACKFSSNGKVDVTLTNGNSCLNLTIKDNGIGIINKDMEKITTPFYRGNNAMKIKGSGIGLSLSSKIISLHCGTLKIESQIEIGTAVHIQVPLKTS